MKLSTWILSFALLTFAYLPFTALAAISGQNQQTIQFAKEKNPIEVKTKKSFREKIGRKLDKIKSKVRHWKEVVQLGFLTGKLLTSLILLLLSIVFFAVGGVTTLGVLFNILGSAAVIAALIFFVLWLLERTTLNSSGN